MSTHVGANAGRQRGARRCHTSAHQAEVLRKGEKCFLLTGDVYRRDSIDRTHYPVFHQMEGFRVFTPEEVEASGMSGALAPSYRDARPAALQITPQHAPRTAAAAPANTRRTPACACVGETVARSARGHDSHSFARASAGKELASKELKDTLEGLAKHLFGDVECRWVDAYFPFTDPSYELEIYFDDDWLEVLGCGVTQQVILDDNGNAGNVAWAFGLGLERLAMVLFAIPDIRYALCPPTTMAMSVVAA